MNKYTIDTDKEEFVSIDDEYEKLNFIREQGTKTIKQKQAVFAMELKNGLGQQMKETLHNPQENQLKVVIPFKARYRNCIKSIKSFFVKIFNTFR